MLFFSVSNRPALYSNTVHQGDCRCSTTSLVNIPGIFATRLEGERLRYGTVQEDVRGVVSTVVCVERTTFLNDLDRVINLPIELRILYCGVHSDIDCLVDVGGGCGGNATNHLPASTVQSGIMNGRGRSVV